MDDRTEVEQDDITPHGVLIGRRGFLGAFAAFAAVASIVPEALGAPVPPRKPARIGLVPGRKPEITTAAARAPSLGRRAKVLNLYNVHTGEKVRGPFWQDGRYVPETMRAIRRMMRDHRANQVHSIDQNLIELMHAIQTRVGAQKPLEIVSAYRSPHTNEMLREAGYGVAENSYHLVGKAVDIRVPGFRISQLSNMAKSMRRGGVGTYGSGNFLHIDTGPVRYW